VPPEADNVRACRKVGMRTIPLLINVLSEEVRDYEGPRRAIAEQTVGPQDPGVS